MYDQQTIDIRQIMPIAATADYAPAAPDIVPWIAGDGVTVIAGESGVGKTSVIMTEIVAPYTAGKPTVFGSGAPCRNPGEVYIISTEDSSSKLRDLLAAAGADLSKIRIMGKLEHALISRDMDTEHLTSPFWASIFAQQPAMVVVDPINKIIRVDANKGSIVKEAIMAPLCRYAAASHTAVIIGCHTNKARATDVRETIKGAGEYIDYADSVLFAQMLSDDDPETIVLSEEKCRNDSRHGSVILKRHREGQIVSYELVDRTRNQANHYLENKIKAQYQRMRDVKADKASDRHSDIEATIIDVLSDAGATGMSARDLSDQVCDEAGTSAATYARVQRAMITAGTIISQRGYRTARVWLAEYFPGDGEDGGDADA